MQIHATSPADEEASLLMHELDLELAGRYPDHPATGIVAAEFEKQGGYFVVAKDEDTLLGCGAFRPVNNYCAEIKRMFVRPAARQRGIARSILRHLEEEIRRRKFLSIVVETGYRQPEAMALYEAEGFFPIPPFLGYVGNPVSR